MNEQYATPPGTLTPDALLELEALKRERTLLRKAFASMLHLSEKESDPGHPAMVLETAYILLDEMGLGAEPVKCLMLKNLVDKKKLDREKIEAI